MFITGSYCCAPQGENTTQLDKTISNINFYYDGGTINITFEDNSELFIDYRIKSNTSRQFYTVYPNDNDEDKIPMTIENMGQLLKEVVRYYEHKKPKRDFYE